jgi:hypothetical protein
MQRRPSIKDMMITSSHVSSSISLGGTQWVYGGRLFIVSERTNKRHHHHHHHHVLLPPAPFLPSSHNKRYYLYITHIQSQLLSHNAAKRPPMWQASSRGMFPLRFASDTQYATKAERQGWIKPLAQWKCAFLCIGWSSRSCVQSQTAR